MTNKKAKEYSFELGPIRPPSEGQDHSLLIRVTRNCPWNKCDFCNSYRGQQFEYRSAEEIKADINTAKDLSDDLKSASWKQGRRGKISNDLIDVLVHSNHEIYSRDFIGDEASIARLQSLVNVASWLASGARTVFLQDGDTLIMRTPELVEVLTHLKRTFPTVERITSYARSKTAARKSLDELKDLKHAGLSRLHIGLESGFDEVLRYIHKGVTAKEHIVGGHKILDAGISLSEYVIPGLGGRRWSKEHATETANVLNQINPDFIRIRSLIVSTGTNLHEKLVSGDFELLTEDEVIDELRLFIGNLKCHSYLASDHISNLLWEIQGQLPDVKQSLLRIIDDYKSMSLKERLDFRLKRRLRSRLGMYGRMDSETGNMVQNALKSIDIASPEMETKVNTAVEILKQRFI